LDNRMPVPKITNDFIEWLIQRSYPGNVRELQHLMEQTLLRSIGKKNLYLEELEEALTHHPLSRADEPLDTVGRIIPSPRSEPESYPVKAGEERGAWVLDMLRRHRFNIKATAETLISQAQLDPMNPPPLTDRSSLTYYLQGECFRLYLDYEGELDLAARDLAGDAPETFGTARSRIKKYVDKAAGTLEACSSEEQARTLLGGKLSKLPEDYNGVIERLARYLWDRKRSGASQL